MKASERLYYSQSSLFEVEANVISCERSEDGFDVVLDRTVFAPEGGGQPSDEGSIDGYKVIKATDCVDYIVYSIDTEIVVGTRVRMSIDHNRRLDHCRQHTGEHIVSGLACALFGAKNVGFHMSDDYMTLDFDVPLDSKQLRLLEDKANEAVWADIPVTSTIVSAEELESMELRKKSDGLKGELRIITIDSVDSCTCCGTHVESTAKVGIIRIVDSMNHRGGTRLWVLCAGRALDDYRLKHNALIAVAKGFSTSWENVPGCVDELKRELSTQRYENKLTANRLCSYIASELLSAASVHKGVKLVCYAEDGSDMAKLKLLGEELCRRERCVCALIGRRDEAVNYQFIRSDDVKQSMRDLIQAANMIFSGKGGGRDDRAQGSAKYSESWKETAGQLFDYIKRVMG